MVWALDKFLELRNASDYMCGGIELQRGCAIVSWAGLGSILARLNSTSDEYSNWGRDQGEAREGPGEASLSLSNWAGFIWATV